MGAGLIGVLVGAVVGFAVATFGNVLLTRVEETAVRGLGADQREEKRRTYATIRRAVLVVETAFFALVGWFVATQVL